MHNGVLLHHRQHIHYQSRLPLPTVMGSKNRVHCSNRIINRSAAFTAEVRAIILTLMLSKLGKKYVRVCVMINTGTPQSMKQQPVSKTSYTRDTVHKQGRTVVTLTLYGLKKKSRLDEYILIGTGHVLH